MNVFFVLFVLWLIGAVLICLFFAGASKASRRLEISSEERNPYDVSSRTNGT